MGLAQLGGDAFQALAQRGRLDDLHADAAAQPAAREVQHVVDQARHAARAALDALRRGGDGRRVVRLALQQRGAHGDGRQRVAQVVAQHGDELLAQLARGALVHQQRLGQVVPPVGLELQRDQLREQLEHGDDLGLAHLVGLGVDGAQVAEVLAVGQLDRHRCVALDLVDARRVVGAEDRVLAGLVDEDGRVGGAHVVAQRGLQRQLAARRQAEADAILHRARDPLRIGDARHRREAHAGRFAQHLQKARHRLDARDGGDVLGDGRLGERRLAYR